MKRTLFIIIGGAALFLIFSLWLYLLLFGTPRSVSEVVGDFGFGDVTVTPISPAETSTDDTTRQIDLSTAGTLYQLTSKPVAGFAITATEDGLRVLYAERGTGHVYQIDVVTGEETRLSQKTLVAVNRAFFAPDGSAVVLVGETTVGSVAHLEELTTDSLTHNFPENADNIAFTDNREVRYTVTSQNGTAGYVYDLEAAATAQLFATPLRDVRVTWNTDEPLIYPRTAPTLRGRLYSVSGSSNLMPTGTAGVSFSALASPVFLGLKIETYTHPKSGNLVSYASLGDAETITLGTTALPEKCAFDPSSMVLIWCASPVGLMTPKSQADWYKGLTSFTDSLWRIDLTNNGTATEVDNLTKTSGRQVDVTDLQIDATGSTLLFKNKNDDTLWLKRLSQPTSPDLNAATDEELLGDGEEVTDGEI